MTRWSEFDFLLGSTRQDALQWERGFSPESAFIPNPLPPEPPIQRDDETATLLSAADTNLGRLDGVASILPHPDLFVANVCALRGRFKLPDRKYTKHAGGRSTIRI